MKHSRGVTIYCTLVTLVFFAVISVENVDSVRPYGTIIITAVCYGIPTSAICLSFDAQKAIPFCEKTNSKYRISLHEENQPCTSECLGICLFCIRGQVILNFIWKRKPMELFSWCRWTVGSDQQPEHESNVSVQVLHNFLVCHKHNIPLGLIHPSFHTTKELHG